MYKVKYPEEPEDAYVYITSRFNTDSEGEIDWDTEVVELDTENDHNQVDPQWVYEDVIEKDEFLNQLHPNKSYKCEFDVVVPLEGYYYTDYDIDMYDGSATPIMGFECEGVNYKDMYIEDMRIEEVKG